MAKPASKNFSLDLKVCQPIDEHLELVGHPLVKQVLTQVLAEESGDGSLGSAFGEGAQPAG